MTSQTYDVIVIGAGADSKSHRIDSSRSENPSDSLGWKGLE